MERVGSPDGPEGDHDGQQQDKLPIGKETAGEQNPRNHMVEEQVKTSHQYKKSPPPEAESFFIS